MAKACGTNKIASPDGPMSDFPLEVTHPLILGIKEAVKAGKTLQQNGYEFDVVYTSVLTRAIQTFNYAADELYCHHIPIHKDYRLN
jgi:bisphosphoglycerate-dependent phosphoglycerate mutase